MKLLNNIIIAGTLMLAFLGCKRELINNPGQYTRLYMPQAIEDPARKELVMTDTLQSIVFGAAYGGVAEQTNSIRVNFKVDLSLIAAYNLAHGSAYLPLPDGSYEIGQTEATIRHGAFNSEALKLKIKTVGGIEPLKEYLLPLSIERVSPELPVNEKLRTSFFLIKGTYQDFDRTGWQVMAVSSQEASNPGSNVFDNNTGTNWHTQWRTAQPPHPHFITADMKMLKNVHGFYFWPASTANGNPQNIVIELSSDGVAWQNAGEFALVNTFVRQNVYLSAAIQARYFKITIKTSTGNTHFTHPTEIGVF